MRVNLKKPFQDKLSPALEHLASLGKWSNEAMESTEGGNLDQLLDELELCYTMASERYIHERFMDKHHVPAAEDSAGQAEWAANRDHGLGDNVDLF